MDDRRIWWRLAWRNLWRNQRRTFITASALAFGYLASVTMIGLWNGLLTEMIETGTNLVSGQLQLHAPDYYPERSMYFLFYNTNKRSITRWRLYFKYLSAVIGQQLGTENSGGAC